MKKIILLFIVLILSSYITAEGFDSIFDNETVTEQESSSSIDLSGKINTNLEFFLDNRLKENEIVPSVDMNIILNLNNPKVSGIANIYMNALNKNSIYYGDFLKEVSLDYNIPNGNFKVGYFIHQWGIVDTVRVVDVINATDLSSGFSMDQLEMKMSEPVILTQLYYDKVQLEFIYKPIFTPIKMANSGRWNTQKDSSNYLTINNLTSYTEPNTNSFEYGSVGTRILFPIKSIDSALMYYRGFYERPSYKYTLTPAISPPYDVTNIETVYTMMNMIGTEFNYVKNAFTFSMECALFLSEDFDSTDDNLYNSRISYTASMNYKIKDTSSYLTLSYNSTNIFNYDASNINDIDTATGLETDHNIIFALHVPCMKDKLIIESGFTYQIPTGGYAILSRINYTLNDDITLGVKANIIGTFDNNENSLYKSWENNDSISLSLSYQY